MNSHEVGDREQSAAEVLELGQALFDGVIDAAEMGTEPFPTKEIRAAAEAFFAALRVLLPGTEDGEA